MPWSNLPDPLPPPVTRRQWFGIIVVRCALVFISLIRLGLCADSWFPVSAISH